MNEKVKSKIESFKHYCENNDAKSARIFYDEKHYCYEIHCDSGDMNGAAATLFFIACEELKIVGRGCDQCGWILFVSE